MKAACAPSRALLTACLLAAAHPAAAQAVRSGLGAAEVMALADQARDAGKVDQAAALYDGLTRDPDADVRAEARFRKGMMLADHRRWRDAALVFRQLLDDRPGATRVRLELARVLAAMDDPSGARKALREAQAAGLPPEVAAAVDQFSQALTSRRRFGGSMELSLAPDSNINRATSAKTLDTVIAPLNLDEQAQAQSGLGVKAGGQLYARLALAPRVDLLAQVSGAAALYRQKQFNDVSASFLVGPEIRAGADRWRPAIGVTRRDYGGKAYARTASATVNWLHPAGRRSQWVVNADLAAARYALNRLQDGEIGSLSAEWQHALTPQLGGSLSVTASRQTARDPGYATASGGVTAVVWREVGRQTLFASAGISRLNADAVLFPFLDRRKETFTRLTLGVVARRYAVRQFAPVVRVVHEANRSTVGLYDFERTTVEAGIERAF